MKSTKIYTPQNLIRVRYMVYDPFGLEDPTTWHICMYSSHTKQDCL